MHRVECSFAHMWFEEKVTEGLVDKLSFSWMRLYSENENVSVCTFQKGDYLCQRHVISKANSLSITFSSVQSLSRVRLFVTPWTAARQVSLSITNSQSSLTLTSIKSVMPSSHLILCRPPNPSQHQALFHYLRLPQKRHQPIATGITKDRALTTSEPHVFNPLWKNFPIYVIAE